MYFDHSAVEWPLVLLVLLGGAVWVFRVVRSKRNLVRIPVGAAAILVVIASSLLLLMDGCSLAWCVTESSARLYSPDRKHVIVIRDWDAGALGGGQYIDLYSYGGLIETNVAGGEWKVIEPEHVRWVSNSEVRLSYVPGWTSTITCTSTTAVHVLCGRKP